jgi:hypothetical protein
MPKGIKKDNGDNVKVNGEKDNRTLSERKSVRYANPQPKKYKPIKPFNINKVGRPQVYADDSPLWGYLIDQITHGRSLSSILREDDMPYLSTVQLKIERDEKFKAKYEKAFQDRADHLADEILELADEEIPFEALGPGANAWVQQKRLQVDARKWVASKLKPRTYGDRLDVSVTDNRISVLGALEQAQQRVAIGMSKDANVLDVEIKQTKEHAEVTTPLAERMDARFSE